MSAIWPLGFVELACRFSYRICGTLAGIRDCAVDDLQTLFEIFSVVIFLSVNAQ